MQSADPPWATLPDEKLLDLRLCDLGTGALAEHRTPMLEEKIEQLFADLRARRIRFRPRFWFSDDWFTPDGVGGVALPFYLLHPRLAELEQSQMLEVEGGTPEWCLKILRHESGHALDNAFGLRKRRARQRLFGRSSRRYPKYYTPRPYSRSYVLHLDMWYAQSHPDEDFAETFAVWLDPTSDWRKRYAGWPALKKLEYMEQLMREIEGQPAPRRSRRLVEPLAQLHETLREHYRKKREMYGVDYPNLYDRDLRRLFSDRPEFAANLPAATFLSRIRKEVRRLVRRWTGVYQYTIDQVFEDVIERCRELRLRLITSEEQSRLDFTILLTVHTMNYLHSGRHRVAL